MIVTIKSPFILNLCKQKIAEGNDKVGYLRRAKFHRVIGESYQINYKGTLVKLLERQQIRGKRIWDVIKVEEGAENNIGRLKMRSTNKDILSKSQTAFQLKINDDLYRINKPYMSRDSFDLINEKNETKATHLRQSFIRREIQLANSSHSKMDNAIFILTLSLIVFVA